MHDSNAINHETLRAKLLHPFDAMLATINNVLQEVDGDKELSKSMNIIRQSTLEAMTCTKKAADTYNAGKYVELRELHHDILSPSSTTLSYCYFILEGLAGNVKPEQHTRLLNIAYQSHHVRRQLINLIDYARLQALPPEANKQFFIHTLLSPSIISMPQSDAVEWDIAVDLPEVNANRRYVSHTLINLIANALQHSTDDKVTVKAKHVNEEVVIEVQDNGCGISEDVQQEIFKPFYQAQSTPDQLGLGLSVASQQIKRMDSSLKIESIEKKGTKASFILPTTNKR